MWCCFGLVYLLPLISVTNAVHLTTTKPSNSLAKSDTATVAPSSSTNGSWHMSPVTVVQARIQGDAPVWNKDAKMWLSKFGDTAELAYMNNLDTVNMASVEGALMFVQAEGINVNEQSVKCERKNKMQYVVFYEVMIAQPAYGIKYYENHTPPEYGKFVAMDSAKCTDENSDLPVDCKVYYGLDGEPDIGPMVGSNLQTSDLRAPYPNNQWFSYPSSCAQKLREEKTNKCRAEYPGGLCPMGVKPDGDKCTFSYKILGYLNIDDLVGITEMGYSSYKEFCEDGGVEFKATNTGSGFKVEESIDFWKKPGDEDANSKRASKMVELYNKLVSKDTSSNMEALPTIKKLTAVNPKCYENSKACATSQYGCSRTLYLQICSVCKSAGDGCEVAPSSFSFPELKLPTHSLSSSSTRGADTLSSSDTAISKDGGKTLSDSSSKNKNQSSSAVTGTIVSSIVALVALVTIYLV
ncbi:unnamed protein product [Peronospora farinosa]|uniref:Uncharacterized protein n=1 Tax=Peronospora farinosa TaxID=134698 RepID=A0ABN8C193_9STRA|nr:unnamed protein product [Peronospora farinosa]